MTFFKTASLGVALSFSAGVAFAETEITWWHAMGGQLGETVNQIAADFNVQNHPGFQRILRRDPDRWYRRVPCR